MSGRTALGVPAPLAPVRLLVIEDEADIRSGLATYFGSRGFVVEVAASGEAALALFEGPARPPTDLVLLDVALPGIDGFEVLRRLRGKGIAAAVICLTARGQEIDRVVGLELGADDYVVKPFFFRELEARVKAVMRRAGERAGAAVASAPAAASATAASATAASASAAGAPAAPGRATAPPAGGFAFGDVRVDLRARCAHKRGRLVELAPKELDLLMAFWARPHQALSRSDLLDAVWGLDRFPTTRTVDTHVARLRKKLEDDPGRPRFFLSVPRVGYRFEPGPPA